MKLLLFIILISSFNLIAEDNLLDSYKLQFKPLKTFVPPTDEVSKKKIELGRKLYLETKLSKAGDISCNSCHQLDNYGVDGKQFSEGHNKQLGGRNSPTVYNAALHLAQFWDGRAKDLQEQALGPIMNPVEMAMGSEEEVLDQIKDDKNYQDLFKIAFPKEENPITFNNIGHAIAAFENTLLTPSRFDEFLEGNEKALNDSEKEGFKKFVETGCTACHSGIGLGGHMYQKLGLIKPYPTKDLGRFDATKNDSDKFFFKVPSLRNIEKTGPYFHDGSIKTLEEAITLMGEYQLGRELKEDEVNSIITFLKSLTAKIKN
ncbi:UNVERIFIED_CONTAM: hypothetical protein GTU68_062585 [Idotea baltica]|nr:hypothetical protein [Idotea baltica]